MTEFNNFSDLVKFIAVICSENIQLKEENRKLKEKVYELEKELKRPERMTAEEAMGYWGIFG